MKNRYLVFIFSVAVLSGILASLMVQTVVGAASKQVFGLGHVDEMGWTNRKTVVDSLVLETQLDKAKYSAGSKLVATVKLTNKGTDAATILTPRSLRLDFVLLRDGKEVYRWSFGPHGRLALLMDERITLMPRDSIGREYSWTLPSDLQKGVYELVATTNFVISADELYPVTIASRPIIVEIY